MAADGEVSLRPLVKSNAAGGAANPFASFGKGLGFGIRPKQTSSFITSEEKVVKKTGPRIRYAKEFLMQFMTTYTTIPPEVAAMTDLEVVVTEADQESQRAALQKTAEEIDVRDWRMRESGGAGPRGGDRDSDRDLGSYSRTDDFSTSSRPSTFPSTATAAASDTTAASQGRDQQEPRAERQSKLPPQQAASKPREAPTPPANAAAGAQAPSGGAAVANGGTAQAAAVDATRAAEVAKMQKAEDLGRQAYKVGATISGEERALRRIKGILNKLTPETFDKLLAQLLEVINTAASLQQTIAIVFENAVEQPTYCALYADLCLKLSRALPSFPPAEGQNRPISFGQILLNTCQDEFEGAEKAREELASISDQAELEAAERRVKKRIMGNMRLISELYKQDMVKDWIMTTCIDELLAARATKNSKVPPEDSIEAACEMISTAGAKLCKSDKGETPARMIKVFKELERLGNDKSLVSRIRFIIKDILELKRSNWVPRREVYTARKLDDIRSQAEAELGMISSSIAASLPTLPTQQRASEALEFELIPPLRSETENWGFPAFSNDSKPFEGQSALLGVFTPAPQRPAAPPPSAVKPTPPAPPPAAPAATPAPPKRVSFAGPDGKLSEEELARKAESLYAEYTSTLDKKEALTCVKELAAPEFGAKLVETGLSLLLNSLKEKEQAALAELLLFLHAQGAVTAEDVGDAIAVYTAQLEDLSLDVPKAPQLLGSFFGSAVQASIVDLSALPELLSGDYGAEPKRDFAAAAFKKMKLDLGAGGVKSACTAAGITASAFLEADPEFDKDAAPLPDWLKAQGLLDAVPL